MRNKFKLSRVAASVAVAITSIAASQAAFAGSGFADVVAPDGVTGFRKATFFAYSPAGPRVLPVAEADLLGIPQTTGKALRKFVDPLPLPGAANAKTLADGSTQKYIPVAVSSKWVNPQGIASTHDYYEIAIVEYQEKFHSDLRKASVLRGYVQIDHLATNNLAGADGNKYLPGSAALALYYPNSSGKVAFGALDSIPADAKPILVNGTDANGKLTGSKVQAKVVDAPHFLGPVIAATRHTPTRMKVLNLLPVGRAEFVAGTKKEINPVSGLPVDVPTYNVTARNGDLFLPVDKSILGAGVGPDGLTEYTQNRASVHLHGGDTPWISDGTPHQWITPAGENDAAEPLSLASTFTGPGSMLDPNMLPNYIKGVSTQNVPDMNDPGDGAMTLYYPNGHTARMEWYHDHTFGATRLNVYAGMASAYLVTDSVESALMTGGNVGQAGTSYFKPVDAVLPPAERTIPMVMQDRTFVPDDIALQDAHWNTSAWGQPGDSWFPHVYETVQDPNQANNWNGVGRWHYGPWFWPVFPALYALPEGTYSPSGLDNTVTTTPEGWNDTPIINGVAYPTLEVDPTTYRFRLLNASNDRMMTFNLFEAKSTATLADGTPVVAEHPQLDANGAVVLDANGNPVMVPVKTEIDMVPAAAVLATDACAPGERRPTLMNAATGKYCTPETWPTDGRIGGVPNPAGVGPTIYQVANESGWLPKVAKYEPTPINYIQDKGRIVVLNVDLGNSGLLIAPAERADVVIDFSAYAGKTLLVYNDSGAPVPAGDPRNDLFTGVGDQTAQGGTEDTKPGYGPNTRTMMQIKVKAAATGTVTAFDEAKLNTSISNAYFSDPERRPVVAQDVYSGFDSSWAGMKPTDMYGDIYLGSLKNPTFQFTPGTPSDGVLSVKVVNGGHGYMTAPAVSIQGPTLATDKTATAVSTLKLDLVTLTNPGSGYTSAPLVTFTGGGGNGAMANAFLRVDPASVAISNPGNYGTFDGNLQVNFTPAPGASANAPAGVTATGYATVAAGKLTGIVITNPGSGYTAIPTPTIISKKVTVDPLTNAITVGTAILGTAAKATVKGKVDTVVLYGTDNTTPAMQAATSGGGGYTDLTTLIVNLRGGQPIDPLTQQVIGTPAVAVGTGKVFDVTLTHPGNGYPTGTLTATLAAPATPTAVAGVPLWTAEQATATATGAAVAAGATGPAPKASYLVKTKTIQELFDPTYGRLNATLGIELPFTSALTQTTIPLGYVDETTEKFADGETQIWKITHNGVDSHPVHFHLLDVQVINRVGWDGFIQPIEPKEMGWKETVMMSPLEDIIVAVRAKKPKLDGFGVPLSERLMDPTQPEGSPFGFTQIDAATGNPMIVTNTLKNFGWEYVWHCHILGHEENDFMRPINFAANEGKPAAPVITNATPALDNAVTVSWADNSDSEFKFEIQRADAVVYADGKTSTSFGAYSTIATALANATTYIDATAAPLVPPTPGTPAVIDPVTLAEIAPAVPGINGSAYGYKVVAIGASGQTESAPQLTPISLLPATAPNNLLVSGTSGSQVALSWTDNSNNEAGFLIERSIDNGATFQPLNPTTQVAVVAGVTVLVNLPQNTTSFVNAGLLPNTPVQYRVAAGNIAGQSPYSNIVSTVTNSAQTVSSVTASVASASSVTLSWTLAPLANLLNQGVTGYVVTRASAAGTVQFNVAGTTTDVTYTDNTAVQNTAYTYTVVAVNAAGMSAVQGIAGVSNPVTTPYAPVGALAAINATASAAGLASSVTVNWTAATPATQYLVERAPGLGSVSGFTLLASPTTVPVGGYIDTTVAPLTAYTYRVTAQNGSPTNAVEQTTSVTTKAAIVVTAPSGLTASAPNFATGATTLTWTDQATNETGFVVQVSTDGGATWGNVGAQVAPRTGTTGLTRTMSVTAPLGATTAYRVLALNLTAGITTFSAPSASVNVVTLLAAPSGLTAAIATANRISLTWVDNSIGETSFRIMRSADGGTTTAQVGTVTRSAAQAAAVGGAVVTFNDNSVVVGNNYIYTVVAANGLVLSPASNPANVAFVAPAAPATLTTGVQLLTATRANVLLTWDPVPVGVTVTVQRIAPGGGGATTLAVTQGTTSFLDTGAAGSGGLRRNTAAYTYQIRTNAGLLSSTYLVKTIVVN